MRGEVIDPKRRTSIYILSALQMSGYWYLWGCMLRFWVAPVCGNGVDGTQYDGVLFLRYASILKGVFLMRLRRGEVGMLRTRERQES